MPVYINAHDPAELLSAIKKKIDDKKIKVWSYQGDRFSYRASQYAGEATLTATVEAERLAFRLKWKDGATQKTYAVMAIYYGRFIEEILSHFDKKWFSNVYAPPLR